MYVKSHPGESAQDVVNTWSSLIPKQVIITSEDYNTKLQNTTDENFEGRYYPLTLVNGDTIYVYNQYTLDRINDFITKVNSSGWNIQITKETK